MSKTKDPAAVSLGRRGGSANTDAQVSARKANLAGVKSTGRPRTLTPVGISRQKGWTERQKAKGLCVKCNQPAVSGSLCARHREIIAAQGKARYEAKKKMKQSEDYA